MGRPKGSKNKIQPKEEVKKEEKAEKVVIYKPTPQIHIEPPKEDLKKCVRMTDPYTKCNHPKEMHYGGSKGHCNTSGCICLEFQ